MIGAADVAAESPIGTASPARIALLKSAALVVLATITMAPTLRGPFFWDDSINIEINRALRSPAGLASIWIDPLASFQYYPLTYSLLQETRNDPQGPKGFSPSP